MEHLSFFLACFIEGPLGACSRSFSVFIPSGGIFLPFSAVFERFGAVFFSIPPPTLPSISLPVIQSVLMGAWNGGLMAELQGFASHGGRILSRGWLPTAEAPGYSRHLPSIKVRQQLFIYLFI